MTRAERNPYVLLNIPFGASRDVATRAFAQRMKGLRRRPEAGELLTELTWALNQVQEALKDPVTALHIFRVPADPGAFTPVGVGVLRPAPERLGRGPESSTDDLDRLLAEAGRQAADAAVRVVAAHAPLPPR